MIAWDIGFSFHILTNKRTSRYEVYFDKEIDDAKCSIFLLQRIVNREQYIKNKNERILTLKRTGFDDY